MQISDCSLELIEQQLFSKNDGEHVMNRVKESWEDYGKNPENTPLGRDYINNTDQDAILDGKYADVYQEATSWEKYKPVSETVCAGAAGGGAASISNFEPENVITTIDKNEKRKSIKESHSQGLCPICGEDIMSDEGTVEVMINNKKTWVHSYHCTDDSVEARFDYCDKFWGEHPEDFGPAYEKALKKFNPPICELKPQYKDLFESKLKESWADYGENPENTILKNFIANLDLDSVADDCDTDVYKETTSWDSFKSRITEGDQQVNVQQQQIQQPQQTQTQIQTPQQINTIPAQVPPQSQIVNPNNAQQNVQPQQQQVQQAQQVQSAQQVTTQPVQPQNVQQVAQQPQVSIQQAQTQNSVSLPETTTWENYAKIKESFALPGGQLYGAEKTDYEKELDKHNSNRSNEKVIPQTNIGDKDAGENGIHNFNDNGVPTGKINSDINKKSDVSDLLKPTKLKPNEKATIVDQKAKFKHWDD